jgi:serine beta-lactamase-like protein LACTB, mitochondrial
MLKGWNRIETWLTLMVGGAGLIILGVAGLFIYVNATATPIHPSAQDAPSATQAAPVAAWTGAVEEARQIARAQLSEQNLPGLSIAVGAGGAIVWAEGFGWADIEKQTKVAPDTRFRIGTLSTPLTSAAAGLLIEQGRLNLDDPIQKHVPEFPEKQWPVTLRQVMAHVAGVPNDGGDEGPLFGQHCDRPVEALPHFADRELRFEPGTEYRYGRFGFIVVSAAIEAAADEPFLTFMRKQIFEPLGMKDTDVDSGVQAAAPDRATSYFPRFGGDPRYGPDIMRDVDFSCYAGAGAFVSTPSDLARFALAIHGGKLLQPATVELLQAPQRTRSGQETGYGLGWDLETVDIAGRQTRSIGHDGDLLGGVMSSLLTFPDHGIVVAITTNTSYADTFAIGSKIAQAFAAHAKSPTR